MKIEELPAAWREQAKNIRPHNTTASGAYLFCAEELQDAINEWPYPVPEVKGTIPVVMYCRNQKEVDELEAAFKQAFPGAETRQLEAGIVSTTPNPKEQSE